MSAASHIRRFAIGDIHGCILTFKKLLKKIDLQPSDSLYVLGDMIDRGPNSSAVLDIIIKLKEKGYNIFPLKGNHEQMLLNALDDSPERIHSYLRFFNSADLLNKKGNIKRKYINLLSSLPLYIELNDFILVHASLDLTSEDIFENKEFMLYSKYHRGNVSKLKNKRLVHGHAVFDLKTIENNIKSGSVIIGIDNGCVYHGRHKGIGKLVCLDLDSMKLTTQTFCG